MQKYSKIGISYFKGQYLPHLAVTLLFCLLSVCFVSFRNLELMQSAKILEMYVSLAGIFLMTPLLMPEQNVEIWQLEKSKATPMWQIYLVRLLLSSVLVAFVYTAFSLALEINDSAFLWDKMWICGISELFLLGAIGFAVSAITNQVVIGYMIAVIYYVANIGGRKYFGGLALFQMMEGKYDFAGRMFAVGIAVIVLSILIRERQK
ncbi:MAG: hypothetical protein HFI37_00905 [Lachnospiraceae bacterium]|jgi:hypothetical protein|nr:hypothetical protein [Lachnospiraceae bacterium]